MNNSSALRSGVISSMAIAMLALAGTGIASAQSGMPEQESSGAPSEPSPQYQRGKADNGHEYEKGRIDQRHRNDKNLRDENHGYDNGQQPDRYDKKSSR